MDDSEHYIVWNLRTGEPRARKTAPKPSELDTSEVAFRASLEALTDEELAEIHGIDEEDEEEGEIDLPDEPEVEEE